MGIVSRLKRWAGAGEAAAAPAAALAAPDASSAGEAARQAGNQALQGGDLEAALAHYTRFAELQPELASANLNRGYVLHRLGRLAEAATAIRRACDLDPASHESRFFLAKVRIDQDDLYEAEPLLAEAVALQPDFVNGWFELGNVREKRRSWGPARQAFERAGELAPAMSAAWESAARVALAERDGKAALALLERAQTSPVVKGMLAEALSILQRPEEALALVDAALEQDPSMVRARTVRGGALLALGRFDEAETVYRGVCESHPDDAAARSGLGSALVALERIVEGIEHMREALLALPDDQSVVNNLALACMQIGRFDEAFDVLRRGLLLRQGDKKLQFALGMAELAHGDMAEGWRLYQSRECSSFTGAPWWRRGQPVAGKRVLVGWEQGLGDTVHFIRYVPELKKRGATVVVSVQERIRRLFDGVWPGIDIVVDAAAAGPIDLYAPMPSLPYLLGIDEPLGMDAPYLRPDASRLDHWRQRIGRDGRPVVGLVWSGNPSHADNHRRSIPLGMLHRAAQSVPGVRFVSLQFEVSDSDKPALEAWPDLLHIGAEQRDMADTAALIDTLDAVLCIDTSVAHVTGALGKPLVLMLMRCPDWRWRYSGDTTAWYPSAHLVRQGLDARWEPVLERAMAMLPSVCAA